VLRPPQDEDAHRIAAICSDPEITRWTNVPSPYTVEDAHAWIAYTAIEREHGSGLHLVAVRQADRMLVGSAALRVHTDPPHGELGYWVAPAERRAGVATRSVALLVDRAFGTLGLPYVEVVVSPCNHASLALARRAGFTRRASELREFKGKVEEFEVWRRDA